METALDPNYAKVLELAIFIASMLPSEVESEVRASIPQSGGGGLAFLLGSLSNRRRCTTPPVNANIRECLNYIQGLDYGPEKKVETIKWWMQMQESKWSDIAKLALSAFTVPASSSPIERVFSWAGMASNKLRNRVKRKTLNAQLFVDLNRKFVD
uniref:HAT C-terminal dimerisation domain-containing protein n=1 Tax=Ditylenchus dipsaci TaxID=166011 RepID=A0A915DYC6_9BILA